MCPDRHVGIDLLARAVACGHAAKVLVEHVVERAVDPSRVHQQHRVPLLHPEGELGHQRRALQVAPVLLELAHHEHVRPLLPVPRRWRGEEVPVEQETHSGLVGGRVEKKLEARLELHILLLLFCRRRLPRQRIAKHVQLGSKQRFLGQREGVPERLKLLIDGNEEDVCEAAELDLRHAVEVFFEREQQPGRGDMARLVWRGSAVDAAAGVDEVAVVEEGAERGVLHNLDEASAQPTDRAIAHNACIDRHAEAALGKDEEVLEPGDGAGDSEHSVAVGVVELEVGDGAERDIGLVEVCVQHLKLHLVLVGQPCLVDEDHTPRARASALVLLLTIERPPKDALDLGRGCELGALVDERIEDRELFAEVSWRVVAAQVSTHHVERKSLGTPRSPHDAQGDLGAEADHQGEGVLLERLVERDAGGDLEVGVAHKLLQLTLNKDAERTPRALGAVRRHHGIHPPFEQPPVSVCHCLRIRESEIVHDGNRQPDSTLKPLLLVVGTSEVEPEELEGAEGALDVAVADGAASEARREKVVRLEHERAQRIADEEREFGCCVRCWVDEIEQGDFAEDEAFKHSARRRFHFPDQLPHDSR
mmetsp:Transcript_10464/g.20953  ORF Transcript_10464/g.20953 Transcript_10464/m.20953 type:complete len:591 (+) Transcript_10464:2380-4152(+)